MDTVFAFLFKYRPFVFGRGEILFALSWGIVLTVVLGIGVLTFFMYSRVRAKSTRRDRVLLGAIRLAIVAVLMFSLSRPVLVLSTSVPQKNFIGVLLDDSRSMQIRDGGETSRGEMVGEVFSVDGDLLTSLSERFLVRFFRFSSQTQRIENAEALTFDGSSTSLGEALDRARQELSGVPLAGLVMVSDGADNSGDRLSDALVALEASDVPVFSVGVGREEFDRDVALRRVETPRSVLKGASLVVDLTIAHRGYRGQSVELFVEDSDRIISQQEVELPGDGDAARVRVHLVADEVGPRLFKFRIPALSGELVTQNNEQEALVIVEDRQEKILYFEGEPRSEVAFLRRAVADDDNLRVVVLQRTAEDKFLRLEVEGEDELAAGFPSTREELFSYRSLILGSVEASFFTHDQLQMIAEFVGQRGGGLLLLGGPRAFAEGGYIGTPLEAVMPVVLEEPTPGRAPLMLDVSLTPAGLTHAVTQLAASEEESGERWENLPSVTSVNPISRIKPGAVELITASIEGFSEHQTVLSHQRYGRGKVLALTIQDSWRWQMHADVPLEDQSHQTFWRQILRWLVSYVPDRLNVATERDRVARGEGVELVASVEDDRYLGINNTNVLAEVIDPTGASAELQMEWSVERDGEYGAGFVPHENGIYEIHVSAFSEGALSGTDTTYVQVGELDTEFYDAEMRAAPLRRIAEETDGRFYSIDDVSTLADDITFSESGTTVIEQRDLWDMPIVFFSLVLLLGGEWSYRRTRGLA
jgi:uncharacterized membrane protein